MSPVPSLVKSVSLAVGCHNTRQLSEQDAVQCRKMTIRVRYSVMLGFEGATLSDLVTKARALVHMKHSLIVNGNPNPRGNNITRKLLRQQGIFTTPLLVLAGWVLLLMDDIGLRYDIDDTSGWVHTGGQPSKPGAYSSKHERV